jgi:putative spermidine/putrescine transport system substrate-binding protein
MLGAHALHPGCAYRWMRYASTARVQARVARFYGATPVNAGACAALGASTCHALHADAAGALLKRIAFRHTPVENCGGGRICVPFARWEQSWTGLRSS